MADELAVSGHAQDVSNLANTGSSIYCSLKGNDLDTKKKIYNAVSDSSPLHDMIGKTIKVRDIIAQNVQLEDMQNPGEMVDTVRVVLIDDKGKAFGTVSSGVMNSLQNIFAIVGQPESWADPLPVIVREKTGRKGFRFLSLELA